MYRRIGQGAVGHPVPTRTTVPARPNNRQATTAIINRSSVASMLVASSDGRPRGEPSRTANMPCVWATLVITTASMNETAKSAWCREQGVYAAELAQWLASATASLVDPSKASVRPQAKPQESRRIKELERNLLRKDRALAETLALLVLSKKVDAIFNKGEDA